MNLIDPPVSEEYKVYFTSANSYEVIHKICLHQDKVDVLILLEDLAQFRNWWCVLCRRIRLDKSTHNFCGGAI